MTIRYITTKVDECDRCPNWSAANANCKKYPTIGARWSSPPPEACQYPKERSIVPESLCLILTEFLESLPEDLGKDSLNEVRTQIQHALRDVL